MAAEPSEDNILMVVEVTQADRETAKRYLKAKNNNAEDAISALLDNEDIGSAEAALRWDDDAWTGDREGGYGYGPQNLAFNDGNLVPLGSSAVPTRGSSPVPSLRRPQTKAEEDEEMERALANSRQGFTYPSQEMGVVGASNNFHQATRSHYDPSKWAMTLHGSSNVHEAREIVLDVEASDRQNQDGQPRFFKHLPSGDYLPSLLTIAHSIPAAREALLMRSHVQPSYGQDPEWWHGHAIRLPRVVSIGDTSHADQAAARDEDIVTEVQRLMAFLDASERSYGCIDNLTTIATERARKEDSTSETVMDQTLQGWESAVRALRGDDTDAPALFHSVVGSTIPSGNSKQDMWSLPLSISEEDRRRLGELTLADVMDSTLWDTDLQDENIHDTFMERCADVLPMRVMQDGPAQNNLGLVIPSSFYVDKYLKENIATSRVVRKEIAATRKRIAQLEELHLSISSISQGPGQGFINALDMIQMTRGMLSGASRDAVLADFEARGIELPPGALEPPESEKSANDAMASKLEDLWTKIGSKLKTLEEEKTKARELLSKLSQTNPPDLEGSQLKHHYTLRGVSTKPNVTYILRPKPSSASVGPEHQLQEDDPMADPDAPPGWMWWRVEFDSSHSPGRIMKTESTQDDVLRAVELEHSSALLVYASDRAMINRADPTLPEPLAQFVATDNQLFRQELDQQGDDSGGYSQSYGTGEVWNPITGGMSGHQRSRRGSQGSTTVNYDEGDDSGNGMVEAQEMDEAPPYTFDDAARFSYGDEKGGYCGGQPWGRGSPEAHEIHLEEPGDEGMEMTETGKGLLADSVKTTDRRSVEMGGMSQDTTAGRGADGA